MSGRIVASEQGREAQVQEEDALEHLHGPDVVSPLFGGPLSTSLLVLVGALCIVSVRTGCKNELMSPLRINKVCFLFCGATQCMSGVKV